MADKYCKKSSFESVADEIRIRAGLASSNKLTPSQMKTQIDNLAIPAQRGSPSKELKTNDALYTIQKGKYTGGSVYIDPQAKTATLTQNGGTVTDANNKPISSVTVPATNKVTLATGTLSLSEGQTSVSITGLSFSPKGYALCLNSTSSVSYSKFEGRIMFIMQVKDGILYGRIGGTTKVTSGDEIAGIPITSTSSVFGSNYVTISGVNGSSSFTGYTHVYVVWG